MALSFVLTQSVPGAEQRWSVQHGWSLPPQPPPQEPLAVQVRAIEQTLPTPTHIAASGQCETQQLPSEQEFPGQQGSLAPPHFWQVVAPLVVAQASPGSLHRPWQQGPPSTPQGRQMPDTGASLPAHSLSGSRQGTWFGSPGQQGSSVLPHPQRPASHRTEEPPPKPHAS